MRVFTFGAGFALAAAFGALATAASAQRLPETSRAESQVNSLNRSMATEQRDRSAVQQNQFELNSLRNELSRPTPPPIAPPPVVIVR